MPSPMRTKPKGEKVASESVESGSAVDLIWSSGNANLLPTIATTSGGIHERRAQILRKPPPATFGAIDVGTNSIHLVMVEISPEGDFRILGRDKEMVQIGKGGFAREKYFAGPCCHRRQP